MLGLKSVPPGAGKGAAGAEHRHRADDDPSISQSQAEPLRQAVGRAHYRAGYEQ
jgi:hypothetical protein